MYIILFRTDGTPTSDGKTILNPLNTDIDTEFNSLLHLSWVNLHQIEASISRNRTNIEFYYVQTVIESYCAICSATG